MAKEIYLYSGIYSYTSEYVISQLQAFAKEPVTLRVNTPGGYVSAGWGIAAKIKEHGNVTIQIDGQVASMGTTLLPSAKRVVALDVSRIMIHRADGPTENDEDQKLLDGINVDLKAFLSRKIDEKKFKEITGYTLDEIFDPTKRIDVWLTGEQAKEIGLVQEVIKMNEQDASAFSDIMSRIAAEQQASQSQNSNFNSNKMTIDDIRAKHPEAYAQIVALGATQERDRVGAWLAFADVDVQAVKKGVEEGKPISQTAMADFMRKSFSKEKLAAVESDGAAAVATAGEDPTKVKTEKGAALAAFEAAAKNNLQLVK